MWISFFLLLSLPLFGQESKAFSRDYLPVWERAKEYTLIMVEAMPDSLLDFKPVPEVRTYREQVGHMMDNMSFLQYYITGKKDSPIRGLSSDIEHQTKQEMINRLETSFDYISFLLSNITDDEADQPVSFFVREIHMTKRSIFHLMRNHVTHHRAQLIVYLRINGIEPPRYVGW